MNCEICSENKYIIFGFWAELSLYCYNSFFAFRFAISFFFGLI